jgi:hypothetical protein
MGGNTSNAKAAGQENQDQDSDPDDPPQSPKHPAAKHGKHARGKQEGKRGKHNNGKKGKHTNHRDTDVFDSDEVEFENPYNETFEQEKGDDARVSLEELQKRMRKRAEAETKEMEEWQASQRKEQANKPVVWQGRAGGSKLTLTAAVATTLEAKENDAHGKKEMKVRKLIGADLIDPEHKRRGMAALVKREHEYAKRAVEYGCDDTLITSRE